MPRARREYIPASIQRPLDDTEVQALHRLIDDLVILEPAALHALHLLVYRVVEAAKQRAVNEHWEALARGARVLIANKRRLTKGGA